MASKLAYLSWWAIVILVHGLVIGCDGLDTGLYFADQPQDVIAVKNSPLVLNCSSQDSDGRVNITWRKDGVLVNDARRYVLRNGSLYFKRVVRRKQYTDEGLYQCVLRNHIGTIVSRKLQLQVASLSHFSGGPLDMEVGEGDAARFQCSILGVPMPTITWEKDRQPIPLNHSRYTVLPSGVLQLTEVAGTDAGLYRCRAVNMAKERHSGEAQLTVLPPTAGGRSVALLATPRNQTVMAEHSVILECLATGVPRPTIQWTHLDGAAVELGRYTYLVGQGNLRIDDVWQSNDGVYVCTASNDRGDVVTAQAQLTVLVAPYIDSLTENMVRPTAHTLRLTCTAQGAPPPDISWLKDGETLDNIGRVKVKGGRLVITQCMPSDSGLYQCVAHNRADMDQDTVRLDIKPAVDAPTAPTGIVAWTISSSEIMLAWDASPVTNGYHIIAYSVHFLPTKGGPELQTVIKETRCTINQLQPHTNYTFYVVSYSKKGASQHSYIVTQATAEDVPRDLPRVVVTGSSDKTMTVAWELMAPDRARGVITTYRLIYRERGHAAQHIMEMTTPAREYTITGLKPDTTYEVLVVASTLKGFPALDDTWPWLAKTTQPKTAAGRGPGMELQVVNSSSLMVTWSAPVISTSDAPITAYKLMCNIIGETDDSIESKVVTVAPTERTYIISQLAPDTWYEVRLWTSSHDGDSVVTTATEHTPVSDDMPVLTCQPVRAHTSSESADIEPYNDSSIRLAWDKVGSSLNVTRYRISYSEVDSGVTKQAISDVEMVSIHGLHPHSMYEFRVAYETKHSRGPLSNAVRCRSLPGRPSAPQNLQWSLQGPALIELRWQPPGQTNGIIVSYVIYYTVDTSTLKWTTKMQNGSHTRVAVDNLQLDTLYYFKMLAATSAGPGPTTNVLAVKTSNVPATNGTAGHWHRGNHDQELGIITGFAIGLSCIIICMVIIFVRSRYCAGRQAPVVVAVNGLNRNGMTPHDELCEMKSYTPMLYTTQHKNSPSNVEQAYYASKKMDTNGYTPMNGARPGYKTNGRVTTCIGRDQPERQMTSPDEPDDPDDQYRSHCSSLDDIDRSLPSLDDIDRSLPSLDDIDRSLASLHSPCCGAASPDETVCSDNSRRPLCARSNPHMLSSERPCTVTVPPSEGGTSECDTGEDVWLRHSDANSEGRESEGTSGSCGATSVQV